MALWKISVKRTGSTNGVKYTEGMFVEMVTNNFTYNPLTSNPSRQVEDISRLFEMKYGVNFMKARIVNTNYLKSELISK